VPHGEIEPSWRKPVGAIVIVMTALIWVVAVASFSSEIGRLPVLVQLPIYVVLGLVWIMPLRPLLQWMETGRWRP
jgi:hypothetical protein